MHTSVYESVVGGIKGAVSAGCLVQTVEFAEWSGGQPIETGRVSTDRRLHTTLRRAHYSEQLIRSQGIIDMLNLRVLFPVMFLYTKASISQRVRKVLASNDKKWKRNIGQTAINISGYNL